MKDPLLASSVGFADLPEQMFKERSPSTRMLKSWFVILGLCLFIALLSFKPSEPYLTEYLLCNYDTQTSYCSDYSSSDDCSGQVPCLWDAQSATCTVLDCANVSLSDCGNDDYNYCYKDGGRCEEVRCYQHFTEDEVNNEIYPWSTYAYLPFLVILGPLAELVSYRVSILFGILGRVVTRVLLLFGGSLLDMQVMQVTYALGTAAEDGESEPYNTSLPLICLCFSVQCLHLLRGRGGPVSGRHVIREGRSLALRTTVRGAGRPARRLRPHLPHHSHVAVCGLCLGRLRSGPGHSATL